MIRTEVHRRLDDWLNEDAGTGKFQIVKDPRGFMRAGVETCLKIEEISEETRKKIEELGRIFHCPRIEIVMDGPRIDRVYTYRNH